MNLMQRPFRVFLAAALVWGRLLRRDPVTIRTGVAPVVLPNAHPDEWQACAAEPVCPLLDKVPHDCMEKEGDMRVHPQCFHFTCALFSCLDGKATPAGPAPADAATTCAPVREEIWSKVDQKGFKVDKFVEECSAGTFTCLTKCPELHALLADENALSRCHSGRKSKEYCRTWLARIQKCVKDNGECGASFFGRMPNFQLGDDAGNATVLTGNASNASNISSRIPADATGKVRLRDNVNNLEELRSLTRSMDAVVRAAQEAFESTFMHGCDPACDNGEECIHGKCIYRPFGTRHTSKVGGVHPPADWWPAWERDRPNHPQRDYANSATAAGREPHRFQTTSAVGSR